jgi:hypothetical protein
MKVVKIIQNEYEQAQYKLHYSLLSLGVGQVSVAAKAEALGAYQEF